jgi:hypothetical protein
MTRPARRTSFPPAPEATRPHLRQAALLYTQRALLGEVSPALRGVTVDWGGTAVKVRCYMDGPISDADRDSMEAVHTELLADFLPDIEVNLEVCRRDWPDPMETLREWAYRRRE